MFIRNVSLLIVTTAFSARILAQNISDKDGILNATLDGKVYFTPSDAPSLKIPVESGKALDAIPLNVPLALSGKIVGTTQPRLVVSGAVNPVADKIEDASKILGIRNGRLPKLSKELKDFYRATKLFEPVVARSDSASDAQKAMLAFKLNQINAEAAEIFSTATPNSPESNALLDIGAETNAQFKAIYQSDDRYSPAIYRMIADRSRGSVALYSRRIEGYCASACLIGTNVILTAAHVLEHDQPEELEAHFNYEMNENRERLVISRYSVAKTPLIVNKDLDFAILRLDIKPGDTDPMKNWPVQSLSARRIALNDQVYVVGFPQGEPKTIADHAKAIFPFQVSDNEYKQIVYDVSVNAKRYPAISAKWKDVLAESYVRQADGNWQNRPKRFQFRPTVGIDSDTFTGNSGSPVYSKLRNNVVGVLSAGEPPSPDLVVSPQAYEAIVPMTVILNEIGKAKLELKSLGIKVEP